MAALRDLGALPARHGSAGRHPRPRPRPGAGRPDDAHRRPAGQGGPAGREGAARLRGADAEGADAVRQEPRVPGRRRSPAWRPTSTSSPRSPTSRCCSPSATASDSGASSASTSTRSTIDLDGVKAGLRPRPERRPPHPPRAAGPPRPDPTPHAHATRLSSVARRADRHRPLLGRLRRAAVGAPARRRPADHGQGRRVRRRSTPTAARTSR